MRFGAAILVLNEWRFMPAVIGQLLKVVDRCVILRTRRPFSGAPVSLGPVPILDRRVEIISGDWKTEHEARNAGMEILTSGKFRCDYVFTLDSDEIITDKNLQFLKAAVVAGQQRALYINFSTYWKTPEQLLVEAEPSVAPVIVRHDVRFHHLRVVGDGVGTFVNRPSVRCFHLSYVRTDEEVKEKIRLFGHAHEIVRDWYEQVWKGWDSDHGRRNLHPIKPHLYERTIYAPDRDLREILREYRCDLNGLEIATVTEDKPTVRPRHARIIGPDNRGGLSRDAAILQRQFELAGWTVEWATSTAIASRVKVQIFLENVAASLLGLADRNIVIPNPEFWKGDAKFADVWAKTLHASEVFSKLGARAQYIGWTSENRFKKDIPRERSFFHVCGQSNRKGTDVLVRAWKPEYPLLTIVCKPATWWEEREDCEWVNQPYQDNIRIIKEYVSDDFLVELQNRALFHIYPSLYEGFGHAIWEALSCGATVFIPGSARGDCPDSEALRPFDDMPGIFERLRVDSESERAGLVEDRRVLDSSIAKAVEYAMSLTDEEIIDRHQRSLAAWYQNLDEFEARCAEAIRALDAAEPYEQIFVDTPNRPVYVCHSDHERCGIAEYGRQLDVALRARGVQVESSNYRSALKSSIEQNSLLFVHYEPGLMPMAFLDTLRKAHRSGSRVIFCCHWFSPELLAGELGSYVDTFIVHRNYGLRDPRVVEVPLACPVYTPSKSRDELRPLPSSIKILTTIGFLSGWKRIPELVEAILKQPTWSEMKDFHLWIQTPAPFAGDQEKQIPAVNAVLEKYGRTRVTFSTKFLSEQELLDHVYASDIGFIFHGQNTNSASAATKQFVSARTPLITTGSSHSSDVREGVARIATFDVDVFAREMLTIARDDVRMGGLRTGMEREYERLNMDTVAAQYAEIFRSR